MMLLGTLKAEVQNVIAKYMWPYMKERLYDLYYQAHRCHLVVRLTLIYPT